MNSNFDIEKVGKRMPYKVPDELFDEMESQVASRLGIKDEAKTSPRKALKLASFTALMVAACLALCFVLYTPKDTVEDIQDIEQTYAQLCESDQDFLIEVFQDDIFLEEDE